MSHLTQFRHATVGGSLDATLEQRNDGSLLVRSTEALGWYPDRLSDCLETYAEQSPTHVFVAQRRGGGDWEQISYAQMFERARSIGQALLDMGLSVDRPLAILSDNDLEHLSLKMGAMWAGIPTVSVSTAYSLISTDHGKLRHIAATTTPGAVYAADSRFAKAIAAAFTTDTRVILGSDVGVIEGAIAFGDLLETVAGPSLDAAHAATGPDTIVKFLFTSGSTKMPKAVVNTHRMLSANQQMIRQCLAFLTEEPPVILDWLPWSHTFGGNHNLGLVLYNGGTLYIDGGKPVPALVGETLRNLREISPTIYFNVPKGYEEIALAMDRDEVLRESVFRKLKMFMYAGAGLSQAIWDKLDAHGIATAGERVRMITSFGMTETSPAGLYKVDTEARSGHIGLPVPGVDVKLAPQGDKTELRFRGPNVMPGYWRDPLQTADAFDEEGFYCTGDAVRWVDAADHRKGLMFDGRIAEDFKLATGTFVSVGPLRAKVISMGEPCVQDVVVTGANRNEVGLLIFPREDQVRKLGASPANTSLVEVLQTRVVRDFFQHLADRLWADGTGSANRPAFLLVLADPPSIDKGEMTDKGSINQRAVLTCREALVTALYEQRETDLGQITPRKGRN